MRVVVIGVGALGTHLVLNCRNMSVDWTFVDFDSVELKNLKSQFFTKQAVGVNKAQALSLAIRQLWGVPSKVFPVKLFEGNLDALLGDADIIVDAVDNASTRDLLSQWGVRHSVPVMHMGIAAGGDFGRIAWTMEGHPPFVADSAPPGTPTCEDGAMLPRIALLSAVGAEALRLALNGKFTAHNVSPGRFRV